MDKSIGALWIKKAKSGMEFMTGKIELNGEVKEIVVFKNDKKKDKQPDYRILLSVPKEQRGVQTSTTAEPVDAGNVDEINADELNF